MNQELNQDVYKTVQISENVTPEIYRKNSFQILSLPVNATMLDIKRKHSQMKMALKLGAVVSLNDRLTVSNGFSVT